MKNKIAVIILYFTVFFVKAQEFDIKNFLQQNNINEAILNTVPELDVEHPDADSIKRYVKRVQGNTEIRVTGYPILVDWSLREKMKWIEILNGISVGILKVKCLGAKRTGLTFNLNDLPEGVKIYFTKPDISKSVSFDEHNLQFLRNNNVKEAFLRQLEGSSGYLIIILPTTDKAKLLMSIKYITYGFAHNSDLNRSTDDFGESADCEIDINCAEGNNWQNEKKGVVRIEMGTSEFTGSLVNNTSLDGTPYVLTAHHCVNDPNANLYYDAQGSSTIPAYFDFGYESSNCNGGDGTYQTIYGGLLVSNNSSSDFALIRLADKPYSFSIPAYYNGWQNSGYGNTDFVAIHHPMGDVKKISVASGITAGGLAQHFIATFYKGVTEPGSSGCPLFNSNHLIIGQLNGHDAVHNGDPPCDFYERYFGAFTYSWDDNGIPSRNLMYWLDPYDTHETTLPGGNYGACQNNRTVHAQITVKRDVTANNEIFADNVIAGGSADVTYKAGQAIHLLPGFSVSPFSYFRAIIDPNPCVPNVPIFKTDENGESFKTITVAANNTSAVKVYPNPFTDQIQIEITEAIAGELLTIAIYDFQGHLLLNSKNIVAGVHENYTIRFPQEFAKGIYILTCNSETISQFVKLIKT